MAGRITFELMGGAVPGREQGLRVHPSVRLEWNRVIIRQHDVYLFGRGQDCHIRLPEDDPLVSRHHFLVECAPPRATLRDLGSLHGTYINGVKHGGRASGVLRAGEALKEKDAVVLQGGDCITIGRTSLLVHVEGPRFCAGCGEEEDDAADSGALAQEAQRPWLCPTCLAERRPHRAPGARSGVRVCCECGSPVLEPTHQTPDGFTLCEECVRHSLGKPERVIARLLARAPVEQPGTGLPEIPGYELRELLGRGGSGCVYRAHCLADQRPVAIKLLPAGAAFSWRARLEFLRETEITQGLAHPHIVRLLDHGVWQDVFYLVTEYCDGGNAESLLVRAGGSLPLAQASRVALETLDALAFIHQAKQVHRDVKPANVLLLHEGKRLVTKLADMGLAKSFQMAGFSGMTVAGQYAGTFEFMPREQLTGFRFMKPSSDVWSLAATFYHLLTGGYPFDFSCGQDKAAIVLESKVVPIRDRDADVPPAIAAVIDRALSPRPEQRYQDAAEMREQLLGALAAESV